MGFFDLFKKPDIYYGLEQCKATPGAVLLDVREADEFAAGHIPGSINLPLSVLDTAETLIPDFGTPIFAYCLIGSRSARAVQRLRAIGYKKAVSIGGIRDYKEALEQ